MAFDPKSKEHKAKLYPVLKALADLEPGKTPEMIMDQAVGYPIARGKDYTRNMRRGDINSTFAELTHQWLAKHHFDLAHRLSPEIFPETPNQRWQTILEERAQPDCLKLVLVPASMGIVERESQLKPVDKTIRLGERFGLELDSETDGYAISLQCVRGKWHNIPLGPDGETSLAIQAGINRLPQKEGCKLDPLSENQDEGQHAFVLVVAQTEDIPTGISNLITWVHDTPCDLHRVSAQFVK